MSSAGVREDKLVEVAGRIPVTESYGLWQDDYVH